MMTWNYAMIGVIYVKRGSFGAHLGEIAALSAEMQHENNRI